MFTEDWELEGRDAPHVDFVTDDLGGFLEDVLGAIGPARLTRDRAAKLRCAGFANAARFRADQSRPE